MGKSLWKWNAKMTLTHPNTRQEVRRNSEDIFNDLLTWLMVNKGMDTYSSCMWMGFLWLARSSVPQGCKGGEAMVRYAKFMRREAARMPVLREILMWINKGNFGSLLLEGFIQQCYTEERRVVNIVELACSLFQVSISFRKVISGIWHVEVKQWLPADKNTKENIQGRDDFYWNLTIFTAILCFICVYRPLLLLHRVFLEWMVATIQTFHYSLLTVLYVININTVFV